MWMRPLDSARGATAAHRAPKRVADGTCTRVGAWMTDKCRRRMNGREGNITTEITQRMGRGGRKKKAQRKERGSWDVREVGSSRPWARGPFSLGRWAVQSYVFFHPQNKLLPYQSPTFGPILYKFIIMGPVWKPRPYNWRRLWESCLCDDEWNSLLRWGQIP